MEWYERNVWRVYEQTNEFAIVRHTYQVSRLTN
nr:MAG TPA: hypothetical protein [Caudoviricetes sp.]